MSGPARFPAHITLDKNPAANLKIMKSLKFYKHCLTEQSSEVAGAKRSHKLLLNYLGPETLQIRTFPDRLGTNVMRIAT